MKMNDFQTNKIPNINIIPAKYPDNNEMADHSKERK